jgi:hypothetical protein
MKDAEKGENRERYSPLENKREINELFILPFVYFIFLTALHCRNKHSILPVAIWRNLPKVWRLRKGNLKGNISMDKVRVVQQVQGALLDGLAEVQEPVEEHKGHVLPAQGPARHPRLVEGLQAVNSWWSLAREL